MLNPLRSQHCSGQTRPFQGLSRCDWEADGETRTPDRIITSDPIACHWRSCATTKGGFTQAILEGPIDRITSRLIGRDETEGRLMDARRPRAPAADGAASRASARTTRGGPRNRVGHPPRRGGPVRAVVCARIRESGPSPPHSRSWSSWSSRCSSSPGCSCRAPICPALRRRGARPAARAPRPLRAAFDSGAPFGVSASDALVLAAWSGSGPLVAVIRFAGCRPVRPGVQPPATQLRPP
jgi:hypothetical protein